MEFWYNESSMIDSTGFSSDRYYGGSNPTQTGVDFVAGLLRLYNNYTESLRAKPKLALEVRRVDFLPRMYDHLASTTSAICKVAKSTLLLAGAVGVAGIVASFAVARIGILFPKIIPPLLRQRARGLAEDVLQILFRPYPDTKGYLSSFLLTCLATGAPAGLYTAYNSLKDAYDTFKTPAIRPILNPSLDQEIDNLALAIQKAKESGSFLQHILLYGPGGTGKTMLSKWMAKTSNINYMMMSGGDLAQYIKSGMHVTELNKIFEGANKSSSPTILFIDEAEALCLNRESQQRAEAVELLNAFLKHTGDPSKKVLVILATNRMENLDPAVLNRMDHKILIGLPEVQERERILKSSIPTFFSAEEQEAVFNDAFIQEIAQKTAGLSGRSLFKLLNQLASIKTATDFSQEKAIAVIDRFISREREIEQKLKP